jgi:hypothetical protein
MAMQKFLIAVVMAAFTTVAFGQTQGSATTQGSAADNMGAAAGQSGAQVNNSTSGTANGALNPSAKPLGTDASAAQSTSAQAAGANAAASQSATLSAVLTKSVDAKKAKEGDQVQAKTTQDATTSAGTKIPRNTKLIGHVTEAKAKAKGESQSTLGFVFDKAVLKNGQEIPLHGVIQAVAAAPQVNMGTGADMGTSAGMDPGVGANAGAAGSMGQRGNPGGVVGGATNTVGNVAGSAAGAVNQTTGVAANEAGQVAANGAAMLNANSTGVVGMKDIQLQQATSAAATSTTGGGSAPVLTSSSNNVRLDSGTQLVVKSTNVSANGSANVSQQ